MTHTEEGPPDGCPAWCVLPARLGTGRAHRMHSSGSLRVGPTVMRLCSTSTPTVAAGGVPFIVVGRQRYTLWEAEALIDALTQLVDSGLGITPRAEAGRRSAGP